MLNINLFCEDSLRLMDLEVTMEREFQKYFSHDTWQEGISCVKKKQVKQMKNSKSYVDAIVEDQKEYHVHITKQPLKMKCTCDYAQEGNRCRHMAAVLLAYEVIQKKKQKEVKAPRTYKDTGWYAFLKRDLNPRGDTIDDFNVYQAAKRYLETPLEQLSCDMDDYLEDLVLLLLFIMKKMRFYRRESILTLCIQAIAQNAHHNLHTKKLADQMIYALMRKVNDKPLNDLLLKEYFNEKEDFLSFIEYAKKAGIVMQYISILISKMEAADSDPDDIEALCTSYIVHKQARDWLVSYYKETKQYEKGIQMLEHYCSTLAPKNESITKEQCDLFVLYSLAKRTVSRNEIFQILVKDRHVKKSDLFVALKDSMSEEEWKNRGKDYVRNWCQGKSQSTCFEIYQRIDAPDLMMEDLLTQGWSIQVLNKYHSFLAKQDPGLVYALYYRVLKDLLQKHTYISIRYEFLYDYPNSKEFIYALKIMLVKLQKEFSHDHAIVELLEEVEETYYE